MNSLQWFIDKDFLDAYGDLIYNVYPLQTDESRRPGVDTLLRLGALGKLPPHSVVCVASVYTFATRQELKS